MKSCLLICLAFLSLTQAQIKVYIPESLKESMEDMYADGEMATSLANFGNPPYGTQMIGKVYLPESNMHDIPGKQDVDPNLACDKLSHVNDDLDDFYDSAPILLVDRGECPFVVKVRNAEDIGIQAVLIVDNTDENPETIIMSDSGAGGNLVIPSFLISKNDGMMIRDTIKKGEDVYLKLYFKMRRRDIVSVEAFISSDMRNITSVFREIYDTVESIPKDLVKFEPHYITWPAPSCENGCGKPFSN